MEIVDVNRYVILDVNNYTRPRYANAWMHFYFYFPRKKNEKSRQNAFEKSKLKVI